jgi:hypothetical protein
MLLHNSAAETGDFVYSPADSKSTDEYAKLKKGNLVFTNALLPQSTLFSGLT